MTPRWPATLVCVAAIVALGALCGLFGYQLYQQDRKQHRDVQFVEAARQAAVNLSTIGHTTAERDVTRILDSSTAPFETIFKVVPKQFVDLVKRAQTDSTGIVTAAGLEAVDGDTATVLVAASVKMSSPDAPSDTPRQWRMRITVEETSSGVKASKVDFVA